MTAIAASPRAERFIYGRLASDATVAGMVGTKIYSGTAPASATVPYITYSNDGGGSLVYGNASTIIWNKVFYLVQAWTTGNSVTSLQTLVDRMLTLLHAERGATGDFAIDYCLFRRDFRMEEVENTTKYQRLGGVFELAVRAASV
jgi:hypothetical protein